MLGVFLLMDGQCGVENVNQYSAAMVSGHTLKALITNPLLSLQKQTNGSAQMIALLVLYVKLRTTPSPKTLKTSQKHTKPGNF